MSGYNIACFVFCDWLYVVVQFVNFIFIHNKHLVCNQHHKMDSLYNEMYFLLNGTYSPETTSAKPPKEQEGHCEPCLIF